MRTVTMRWTQRNINRITTWFKINYLFDGYFTSAIGPGGKTANDGRIITFWFSDKPPKGDKNGC